MKKITVLKSLINFVAWFCILLGLVVIIGWYTHTASIIQVLPNLAPMQYNTALAFLLSGAGLLFIFKNKVVLGRLLISIVGLLGLLTLLQYIFVFNLGIDEIFMEHYIMDNVSHIGRMAPNTALNFFLTSIALFIYLIRKNKKNQITGVIGSLIFGLGLVAFVGYFMAHEVTIIWVDITKMAVHTSIGFILLGTGITSLSVINELKRFHKNQVNNDFWLSGYSISLALIVFAIDISLPLGFSTSTLYITVMLFAWFIKKKHITQILAFFATLLIFLGYLYSNEGADQFMVLSNRILAIMLVWISAWLVQMIKKRENDQRVTNVELAQNLVRLENKNKELAQFAFIASHDLQEPLRTLTNFTNLFKKQYNEKIDDRADKYLHFISQASDRMSNLIKGLLDYSRIGQDKKMILIDTNKVIETLQKDLYAIINETGTSFFIEPLPNIKGYKVEIRLLFQNLILNAIKFSKNNKKPKIEIRTRDEVDFHKFIVEDNGIGIAKENQKKIFTIFQRLHTQKEYDGTGIGLAHCQKIVELHEGNIKVYSTLDKGSKFVFTISKHL
jgi:signal transduction histidine kinase